MVLQDGYIWKLVFLGTIGFLRCFIHTPIPLVLAEEYPQKFSSAFSLSMAVSGSVMMLLSLIIGTIKLVIMEDLKILPLSLGVSKKVLQSDIFLCHLLTLAYVACVVSWTIELTCCRRTKKAEPQ